MKKIIFALSALLFVAVTNVNAQDEGSSYNTAIGIQFYPGAITVKHFVNSDNAIEGLGYFWSNGFRVTGLYEFHHDIGTIHELISHLKGAFAIPGSVDEVCGFSVA